MASTINVKIAPLPRGAYSSSATYAKLDVVSYNGSSYMAIKSVPTGTVPTNTAYWQLLVQAPTISDGSITTDKIADGAISEDKLDGDVIDLIKGAYPSDVEKGNIASFPDGSEMPVEDLKVHLEPIQDLNGYDSPWVGGAGKNKLGGLITTTGSKIGVTYTANSDGSFTVNGTNSSSSVSDYRLSDTGTFPLSLPVGNYILSGGVDGLNGTANTLYISINDNRYVGTKSGNGTSFTIAEGETITSVFIRMASGATASNAVFKPMIRLASETDATFTPYSNICPITGHTETNVVRTGKNLFDEETVEIGKAWDGASNSARAIVKIPLKEGSYVLSLNGTNGLDRMYYHAYSSAPAGANQISSFPFAVNLSEPNTNLLLQFNKTAISINDIKALKLQLELGSSATSYEPYQGDTYNIPLNQTVYGGTLDVTTGVLTVDKGAVDLGSLTWIYESAVPRFYSTGINSLVKRPPNNVVVIGAISSAYTEVTFNQLYTTQKANGSFALGNTGTLSIINTAYTNASTFKTAMSGVYIVYPLATPQTYQLTPTQVTTLLGHNNMWADSGEVEVKYLADTSLYIQKLTGSTEDDMVANQNISANKYFMVGNELYYSTTAIASGETIVVGSNCTKTNLAEALNALNQ